MNNLILAAVAAFATQLVACTASDTPWPRVPPPSSPVVADVQPLSVPPVNVRDDFAESIERRAHAADMRLFFAMADTAQQRMAAADAAKCKLAEDQSVEVLREKRQELGVALIELSVARGDLWLDALGKAEATFREYDAGVDKASGLSGRLASVELSPRAVCQAKR